jgi:hypothetical protein
VDDSHFGYKQKFLKKSTIGLLVSYNSAEVNICIALLVFYADYFLKKGVARSHLPYGTCQNAAKHGKSGFVAFSCIMQGPTRLRVFPIALILEGHWILFPSNKKKANEFAKRDYA